MGEKYRPSNGTEGAAFISAWCCDCERDKNEDCQILAATFRYDVTDPDYPKEWQCGKDGPCCTAWHPLGEPLPLPRDEHTVDMFSDS